MKTQLEQGRQGFPSGNEQGRRENVVSVCGKPAVHTWLPGYKPSFILQQKYPGIFSSH